MKSYSITLMLRFKQANIRNIVIDNWVEILGPKSCNERSLELSQLEILPLARIQPAQASSHKQENPSLETSLLPHLKGCEKSDLDPTKVDYATEL